MPGWKVSPLTRKRNLSIQKAEYLLKKNIHYVIYQRLEGRYGYYKGYPVSICMFHLKNPCKGVVENPSRFTWLFDF